MQCFDVLMTIIEMKCNGWMNKKWQHKTCNLSFPQKQWLENLNDDLAKVTLSMPFKWIESMTMQCTSVIYEWNNTDDMNLWYALSWVDDQSNKQPNVIASPTYNHMMNHMITRWMDNEPHIDQIILMDLKPKMQDNQDPQCKRHRGLGFCA